jgi:hypothetical protein
MGIRSLSVQAPSGRLLHRSGHTEDRPAPVAAQLSLLCASWLLTYLLAGWAGARLGLDASFLLLGLFATAAWVIAWKSWPSSDPEEIGHRHADLLNDHPHPRNASDGEPVHAHVIDDLHSRWPK